MPKRKGGSPQRKQRALDSAAGLIRSGKYQKGHLEKLSGETLTYALQGMKRTNKAYGEIQKVLLNRGDAFNGGGFR